MEVELGELEVDVELREVVLWVRDVWVVEVLLVERMRRGMRRVVLLPGTGGLGW